MAERRKQHYDIDGKPLYASPRDIADNKFTVYLIQGRVGWRGEDGNPEYLNRMQTIYGTNCRESAFHMGLRVLHDQEGVIENCLAVDDKYITMGLVPEVWIREYRMSEDDYARVLCKYMADSCDKLGEDDRRERKSIGRMATLADIKEVISGRARLMDQETATDLWHAMDESGVKPVKQWTTTENTLTRKYDSFFVYPDGEFSTDLRKGDGIRLNGDYISGYDNEK